MNQTNHGRAAGILATSFLHYPLMLYAFKGRSEAARLQALQRLYKHCVAASDLYGGVLSTEDQLGALIWLPGKNFPLTLRHELRSGMALIPVQIGIPSTLRLLGHDTEPEAWIRQQAGPNMGYIWCVGVLPDARGKGYSRQLIEQSIDQMRSQGLNSCWLKTEDPKNVDIYKKLGFTVMRETVVKSSGITSWAMRRQVG